MWAGFILPDQAVLADPDAHSGATWAMGDFNGDEKVDDVDATMLAVNWGRDAAASAPEPSTTLLLLIGVVVMLAFARRRQI